MHNPQTPTGPDEQMPSDKRMQGICNRDAPGDEADGGPRPRKKQRKQRPCFSCAECRRLKMKCNRQVPCSNCVRRQRVEFCIAAPDSRKTPREQSEERLEQEEDDKPADAEPHGVNRITSPHLPSDHQRQAQGQYGEPQQQIPPQGQQSYHLEDAHYRQIGPAQQPMDGPRPISMQGSHGTQSELNPLDLLAHALEPCVTQGPFPRPFTSASPGRIGEPSYNIPTVASASSNPTRQSIDDGEQSGSYGTLMLSKRGRSKYLGPTAGSEWLKESEMQDVSDTPLVTRAPSPAIPQDSVQSQPHHLASQTEAIGFPFNTLPARMSTRDLLSSLPPREEAWALAESYYRYCAWHHDVAPKAPFEKMFERIYDQVEGRSSSPPVNPQEIALVFIIMAQGTMFNIEMANYDSSAEDWLHLSERALVQGNFLSSNMVAGLQTLHLMAHLHLQLDKGRRGDIAWPLWGMVMRLIQAMGMHRDGDRWNLPQDIAEERRKVFWECNAADTFQAHCFSRPAGLNPEHCDTAFPAEPLSLTGEKSYYILRFELSQISSKILNMAMKVQNPAYSDVTALDLRLAEFERNIPFSLRCRAALLAMPSRYPHFETAMQESPEPSRRALTVSFQQTNLSLNVSETIINLHRPYYAKALYDVDRARSIYQPSFFVVIERCALIISIVADIHTRFPAVSTRQWNFWYHVFGSALCLGTLVLRDPTNALANFILVQIDAAISLFTSLLQHGARTPRYMRNLEWLINLRSRAMSKVSAANNAHKDHQQSDADPNRENTDGDGEQAEDVELLGWRTRLIERAGHGRQKIVKTIHLAATPTESQNTDVANPSPNETYVEDLARVSDIRNPSATFPGNNFDSTEDILREFWDPMLLQDVLELPTTNQVLVIK